jgi:hypothetical protein
MYHSTHLSIKEHPMTIPTYKQVLEEAQQLSLEDLRKLRDQLTLVIEGTAAAGTARRRSSYGVLAHLGTAPSTEDIDEARHELWANFLQDEGT